TIDFNYDNPRGDIWVLEVDGEALARFTYEDLPAQIASDVPFGSIRVYDGSDETCSSEVVEVHVPCCEMRAWEGQVRMSACQPDGSFYLVVGEVVGTNLSDSLLITYAPAGSSIVETITLAYGSLPVEIGPLHITEQTTYQVVLSDALNTCAQSYQVVAERCDNTACVEFEDFSGIYNTALGYEDGEVIYRENGVALSYELSQNEPCNCILFGAPTASVPGARFGAGQGVFTENAGFGLNFANVETMFNTVNMDFYYLGGGLTLRVNGAEPVRVEFAQELPMDIAPGVSLQVSMDPEDDRLGVLTFSGEVETIEISTSLASGFDNVCMSQDDNVWPGDGNYNGIADHFDLLNLGIAYGSTGPARTNASSEWSGFVAANWRRSFADGLNYKHADANGDGQVDAADREVLVSNYGQVHGSVQAIEALPYTDIDPPIFVDLEEGREHRPGGAFQIPIVAGSAESEMRDVYGMAFTIQLDPNLIDLATIEIVYPVSWFGDPEVNTMNIHRLYPDGRLEIALSRIDGNNVSGHGTVVYVRGLIDDIAGLAGETVVLPDEVLVLDNTGVKLPVRPVGGHLVVTSTSEGFFEADLLRESFRVFPNPTQNRIFFSNALNLPVDHISLFATDGREIRSVKNPGNGIDLRNLPAGMYLVKARIQGQIITEKVIKTEP
ncbi:MAG: T9SS C-terminal target domain-containing protein, partial [Bacteroidetes bacterium]